MYIDNIKEGAFVTFRVTKNASFDTNVTSAASNGTFRYITCNPIYVEGKIVTFDTVRVCLLYTSQEEKKCYAFENVVPIYNRKLNVYIIPCNMPARLENRRASYRVLLSDNGVLKHNSKQYECFVRDISETGVGILVKSKLEEIDIGSMITTSFNNSIMGRQYDVPCKVVSIREVAKDRYVYGCVIQDKKREIPELITAVQRYNLASKRR